MRVGFGVGISYINAPILSGYIDKEEEHEAWLWEDDSYMLWNNNEQVIISYKEEQEAMIESIKQAMVLWYDIKRQGCTNENMAVNPVLKDLSGNGHDATCYNFAWSGMSGIGGIYWEIQPKSNDTDNGQYQCDITVNNNTVTYTFNVTHYGGSQYYSMPYYVRSLGIPETKAKVKCNNDTVIHYRYWDGTKRIDDVISTYNEVITLPEGIVLENDSNRDGFFVNDVTEGTVITIEFIPEYPNALVSDGVDDYCLVEGLSSLSDFTVMFNLQHIVNNAAYKYYFSKGAEGEFNAYMVGNFAQCFNIYGIANNMGNVVSNGINCMTLDGINGTKWMTIGDKSNATDRLTIFTNTNVQGNPTDSYLQYALYSIMLFNRTLTNTEIEWVKSNLIEGDYEL